MNRTFINRAKEREFLNERIANNNRELLIFYGRRRVGKTELLVEASKKHKHIYFLADKRGTRKNAERFAKICATYFNDLSPQIENFDDVFRYLTKRVPCTERFIVIIDEFSYLVEKDDSIPSVFQLIWDDILKSHQIILMLCGSSMSMMYEGTLSYKSPLYGRRTGDWEVLPLSFKDTKLFFPRVSFKEIIERYSIVGNIPAYIREFTEEDTLSNTIAKKILTKGSFLYKEPEVLLREELREPSSYFSILEAMTKHAKLSNIASASGIAAKDLPKYLHILIKRLKLVHKKIPLTETRSKKSLYGIADWFLVFWFRFVFPYLSELEEGKHEEIMKIIKRDFSQHVSIAFEDICREAIRQHYSHFHIGSWWEAGRDSEGNRTSTEIDILGINESSKELLMGECKWKEGVHAEKILSNLQQKAQSIAWHNHERKERYLLFARSFKSTTPKALCIDLDALEKMFGQ